MKKINLLVLAILLISTVLSIPLAKAQEENFDTTNMVSIEEEITLEELNLTEKDISTDESFFGKLRNRLKLFNFNEEERIKARERLSNIKLWKAKKYMAQDDENTKAKGIKALEKYRRHQIKINKKLENLSENKKKKYKNTVERIEKRRIKHHGVLEKIEEKYPKKKINFIQELKEKNAQKIEKRFKNLPDSEKEKYLKYFKEKSNLSNIKMLERLDKDAPEKFKKKIKSITDDHALRLKKRIKNVKDIKEVEKFERKFKKKRPAFTEEIEKRKIRLKEVPKAIQVIN